MPVREIPKNFRNVTGIAASGNAVGPAQFESTLERDFLALLDFSTEVARYEVQPVRIEWSDGRKKGPRHYTPDVLVEFVPELQRQPWLCEVKYRADLAKDWATLHPKLRQGVRYAKQHGWRFRLITEVEVRTQRLVNIRFLSSFGRRNIPQGEIETVLAAIAAEGRSTPAAVLQLVSSDVWRQAEYVPALWHLVARHQIGVDLETEITMQSPIWRVS
ncbi:MAG: TnsA endonuclease N-terminal domain-containing protein [Proteobacteria bacterium]|nr:TnsA endonuclease N-terminal domain-containing protein [Pseudomonadota bacterium]MBS0553333.1 TnsA endonuclease N-terminal domain-containing protein [Pseudomonadota bacterium]